MDRLLLIHLSDLHFGSSFEGTLHATRGFQTGLNGHDLNISQHLSLALIKTLEEWFPVQENDAVEYLISGDLTRTGSDFDFQLVYTYLYSEVAWMPDRLGTLTETMGLNLDKNHVYHIPGNHDHWKGQSKVSWRNGPPAFNANAFPDLLEPTPWRRTLWSPNRKFAMELIAVDSNEGLKHQRTNLRARGVLSDGELRGVKNAAGKIIKPGLRQLLADAQNDADDDQLPRVVGVACHHSFGNKHGITGAHPLDPSSMNDLLQEIRNKEDSFQVATVLTGHTHYALCVPNPKKPHRDVWEARSAATVQCDPQPGDQGFWVHEVGMKDDSTLTWNAWKISWNGTRFRKSPAPTRILK